MELALQVVGLRMTGNFEDAKSVALRIVRNAANDKPESNSNPSIEMQMTSSSARDLRPLLFARAAETDNFENRIINFLSILDTPMGRSAPYSANAISYPSSSGLTLLHLSTFLGFDSLTHFLIGHGADLDARDRNGFTPLHFAALSQTNSCALALIKAGADMEIVNSLGKTAQEIASFEFFGITVPRGEGLDTGDTYLDDDDATFGDIEEDDDIGHNQILRRRIFNKSSRLHGKSGIESPDWSSIASRANTPPPALLEEKAEKENAQTEPNVADAKWAASFIENLKMIPRTLTQIPAHQKIISHIPQLSIHLSDLPGVPWGTLYKSAITNRNNEDKVGSDATKSVVGVPPRTAQDWRATWEKWVALALAAAVPQQTDDVPPPEYTPTVEEETQIMPQDSAALKEQLVASTSRRSHPETRPVGYDSTPVPDQVVESFTYQPSTKQNRRPRKKRIALLSSLSH